MSRSLLDRKLLFVTGKGGVGKSTISCALAVLAAQHDRRVLLCEVDAKGDLAEVLECSPITFDEREVSPGLFAMSMSTEDSLREYLRLQLRVPLLARIGPLARTFDFVANAAPGVKEILTTGKLCWEVRSGRYDLIVVDASASGHIVSQLSAPQAMADLVKVGAVREQTAWMLDILADPTQTGAVVVATPEEMPVNETLELAARLRAETPVDLPAVVVNRVLPELFTRGEEDVFRRIQEPLPAAALATAVASINGNAQVQPVIDGADLAVRLRRSRTDHLARLRAGLDGVELLYIPEMFQRTYGLRATRQVADALGAELGF